MYKNHGSIVGTSFKKHLIEELFRKVATKAFADEGGEKEPSNEPTEPTKPSFNFEDLIKKARKEEKDKLYPKIKDLQTQNSALTEQHNSDLLRIAELEEELKEAKESSNGSSESQKVTDLKKEVKQLKAEKKELKEKVSTLEATPTVDENELRATIEQEYEEKFKVKEYRMEQLAKHTDDIFTPELVIGNTNEEIDASIQREIERSNEIKGRLGVGTGSNPSVNNQHRTPKAPSNPSVSRIQDNQLDLNSLATMDVSSPEYKELRKQLGLK